MGGQRLQLFCVECRPSGETHAHAFYVPALDADEAMRVAEATARDNLAQGFDVVDPFQKADLEVRVGSYGSSDPPKLQFGDWSPFRP